MHAATWMTALSFALTLAACSSSGGTAATGGTGTTSAGATSSGSASSTGGGGGSGGATVSGGTTGSGGSGPCGMLEGQPCCDGNCNPGLTCQPLGPGQDASCICDFNQCPTYSWGCVGNTEVYCHADAPDMCPVPVESHPCPSGMDCSPDTGTCGGCDPNDDCFGHADGEFLTCGFGGLAYTCKLDTDGCVKRVGETCGISCEVGVHNGCCGGQGQMCCDPPGAPCVGGLSCQNGACAP